MKNLLFTLLFLPLFGFAQSQPSQDSLKLALSKTQDISLKADIAIKIVDTYLRNQPDSTRKYLDLARDFAQKSKNVKSEARTYVLNAILLQEQSKFEESIRASQRGIELYEKINDSRGLGRAYYLLAHTYKNMGGAQHVKALAQKGLEYVMKSVELFKLTNDTIGFINAYNNMGIIYRDLNDTQKAKESYLKGMEIAQKCHIENVGVGVLYANLGQIYMDHDKNYDAAIRALQKAVSIHQKVNNQKSMEHAYRNMAQAYRLKNDYNQAISYAQKSVAIAEKLQDVHRQFNAYQVLSLSQEDAGAYKEALGSLQIAKNLEDSLVRAEKTKSIAEMEAKYETVKKDAEIKVLNKDVEFGKLRRNALITIIILLFITGAVIISSLIQRRKREQIIHLKEKAIEEEKLKNIEQELEFKKKELTAKVLQLARKNEFLGTIEEQIGVLKTNVDSSVSQTSNRIRKLIQQDMVDDTQWEQFSSEFSSVHQGFIDALVVQFGSFTKSEIRLISLLKMNLSSKDIANTLNISDEGIKKARYRLRKKLNLESEEDLQAFLLSF